MGLVMFFLELTVSIPVTPSVPETAQKNSIAHQMYAGVREWLGKSTYALILHAHIFPVIY